MIISHRFKKVFLINVIAILLLGAPNYISAQEKLSCELVDKIEDFSYGGCVRKKFFVVMKEGTTKEEIRKVAIRVYNQKKRLIPDLEETQVGFYYPDLNINRDMPNAVANWNIGSSGKWEMSYLFLRVKQPEVIDEIGKSILRRDEFKKGIFVTYDLIVLHDTSDKEAEKILRKKLNDLKEEWQDKVERVEINVFLGEKYLPFMEGQWVSAKSSCPKKGINIEIDKDGRRQTKKQTKILSSEQMRRKIFYESVQAEDKSVKKAEQKYPNDFSTQIDYQRKLQAKYEKELTKKYELTKKHLFRISIEGVSKNWPMP